MVVENKKKRHSLTFSTFSLNSRELHRRLWSGPVRSGVLSETSENQRSPAESAGLKENQLIIQKHLNRCQMSRGDGGISVGESLPRRPWGYSFVMRCYGFPVRL